MTAQMPEECVALFMKVFRTLQFDIQYCVPSYVAWLLAQDARGTAERLYRDLGLDLGDAARAAMQAHLAADAAKPRSRHEHRLEDSGLVPGAIRERFAAYRERFW
jgi:hypothetical protein